MDFKAIKDILRNDLDRVISVIEASIASDIDLLDKTNKSILSHSGKQLRPVLTLLAARACSGGFVTDDTVRYAAASELLHNATLLHDDVADDSRQRRGMPTVMSLLGGRASVLLGDFWLVKAMENILKSDNSSSQVIRIFAKTLSDLAEGELLQLQKAEAGDTMEADYNRIIYSKTASLFEASMVSGAVSVSASDEARKAVRNYARTVGMAFQIKDDILDYDGDSSIGKPVGNDLRERKITLPLIGALANVGADEAREVRKMVCDIDEHPEYQGMIVSFVRERGGIEYACSKLSEYVENAKIQLRPLGGGADVEMLSCIADFVSMRKS